LKSGGGRELLIIQVCVYGGESRLFGIADRRMAERVVGRTGRVAGALGVRAAACSLPFLALLQRAKYVRQPSMDNIVLNNLHRSPA